MNSALKVLWPLAIVILVALMALRRGGTSSLDNPLADHRLEGMMSIGKR